MRIRLMALESSYVDDVLALVALLMVWTSTRRKQTNVDIIYIPRRSSNFDAFLREVVSADRFTANDKHPMFRVRNH